jgi:hypothetical protein
VPELSDDDEYLAKTLLALRGLSAAQRDALDAFDSLIENADPGFDPDPVAEFDERTIAMEHLAAIRCHVDALVRLLAAQKGKHVLADLIERFEAANAEDERVKRDEPIVCSRCGLKLGSARSGGVYVLDGGKPRCVDDESCDARRRRTVD